jgi:heat shock protein htpG
MRRMKEMAAMQPGMNFYGDLPDSYTVVVNTEHPLVKAIAQEADDALDATVEPLLSTIDQANAKAEETRKAAGTAELSTEARATIDEAEKTVTDSRKAMDDAIDAYSPKAPKVSQLVDLALLGNGLLRGEALSSFIAHSVELMK